MDAPWYMDLPPIQNVLDHKCKLAAVFMMSVEIVVSSDVDSVSITVKLFFLFTSLVSAVIWGENIYIS